MRYVCYNKTRHAQQCDGQTGYTVRKLDAIMETVVHSLFEHLNDVPKDVVIAAQYSSQIAESQAQLSKLRSEYQKHAAEVLEYEAEVIRVIRGKSNLNPDLLNKLYEDAKGKATEAERTIKTLEARIQNNEQMKDSLSQHFDVMKTWADIYDVCDLENKKMILSRIMKSIRVKRGYEIEIDLTVECEQLGIKAETVQVL